MHLDPDFGWLIAPFRKLCPAPTIAALWSLEIREVRMIRWLAVAAALVSTGVKAEIDFGDLPEQWGLGNDNCLQAATLIEMEDMGLLPTLDEDRDMYLAAIGAYMFTWGFYTGSGRPPALETREAMIRQLRDVCGADSTLTLIDALERIVLGTQTADRLSFMRNALAEERHALAEANRTIDLLDAQMRALRERGGEAFDNYLDSISPAGD